MPAAQAVIAAVIFDADGTLVDSEELGLEVLAGHARVVGIPLDSLDMSSFTTGSMLMLDGGMSV